ncbi:MAG: hypothetical protein D6B25_10960 [Desulfobulbaceae bacterium]|nr:MAG: hypothetical protein D6B25_10960 [Desulfobulbaceae bacterium]
MDRREETHTKQCLLTTRDWDTYQTIMRTCINPAQFQSPDPLEQAPNKVIPTTNKSSTINTH